MEVKVSIGSELMSCVTSMVLRMSSNIDFFQQLQRTDKRQLMHSTFLLLMCATVTSAHSPADYTSTCPAEHGIDAACPQIACCVVGMYFILKSGSI